MNLGWRFDGGELARSFRNGRAYGTMGFTPFSREETFPLWLARIYVCPAEMMLSCRESVKAPRWPATHSRVHRANRIIIRLSIRNGSKSRCSGLEPRWALLGFARTWGGQGMPRRDKTDGVAWSVEALQELLPVAKECNFMMVIENHGGPSAHAEQIVKIIESVDPDWVGSCPDFGNFRADDRYEQIEKVVPYAKNVHAKTHKFTPDSDEVELDFPLI